MTNKISQKSLADSSNSIHNGNHTHHRHNHECHGHVHHSHDHHECSCHHHCDCHEEGVNQEKSTCDCKNHCHDEQSHNDDDCDDECHCHDEQNAIHHHSKEDLDYYVAKNEIMNDDDQIHALERKKFGHFHPHDAKEPVSTLDDCDICGESLSKCNCDFLGDKYQRTIYRINNLDCKDCAAILEGKLQEAPILFFACINFTHKELHVISEYPTEMVTQEIQKIAKSINEEISVSPIDSSKTYQTISYEIPTLDCAACALKLEKLINKQPGVLSASISYATKTLKLTAENPDELIPHLTKVCNEVENPTRIVSKSTIKQGHDHDHGHDHHHSFGNEKGQLLIGGAIFVIGMILHYLLSPISISILTVDEIAFLISYLILGGPIVKTAAKNLLHGEFFDETFLMSVATLGAVGIKEYPEAVGVMFFYRIGEYFQDLATDNSRKRILETVDMRPENVILVNGEERKEIPAAEAKIGDLLLIRPGDRIPLDGMVVEGYSQLDTSAITGEPKPILVAPGTSITSGCINQTGTISIRVEKVLSESMVSKILDSVENAVATKPKIDRFITRFSRVYTPTVVFLALAVAILPPLLLGYSWERCIYTALTFLVISCPCALVISVPLTFFSGIGAASKEGILFKSGISMEVLSRSNAVVMDKTGTLTEGKFGVSKIISFSDKTEQEVLSIAASAELFSVHPIAKSIVLEAQNLGLSVNPLESIHEIAGQGISGLWNDSKILVGNRKLMENSGIDASKAITSLDGTHVLVSVNEELVGQIVISDKIKTSAKQAIHEIKDMKLKTVMLTGDNHSSAQAIANKLGIMEVHAEMMPDTKLSEIKKLRKENGVVLYVGDGINDAPVLAGADIGAAMGSGADAAIEAADVVYLNSNVDSIPLSIRLAQKVVRTAWENVFFALFVKIAVMILGILGYANMWISIFADTGITILCIFYAIRLLKYKF